MCAWVSDAPIKNNSDYNNCYTVWTMIFTTHIHQFSLLISLGTVATNPKLSMEHQINLVDTQKVPTNVRRDKFHQSCCVSNLRWQDMSCGSWVTSIFFKSCVSTSVCLQCSQRPGSSCQVMTKVIMTMWN